MVRHFPPGSDEDADEGFDEEEPSGEYLAEQARRSKKDPIQQLADDITADYQEYRNKMRFIRVGRRRK